MAVPFSCCVRKTVFIFVLLTLTRSHMVTGLPTKSSSQDNHCHAPNAIEGRTAVMTFYIPQDIDLDTDLIFGDMARRKFPNEKILLCDKNSPLKCEIKQQGFRASDIITNHSLVLQIPNVTKAFQDTYELRLTVNDTSEPVIYCRLTVRGECTGKQWRCANNECISKEWRCDDRDDCEDSSDEQDCDFWCSASNRWKCRNQKCISSGRRCDKNKDCTDGSDEENCDGEQEFGGKNGYRNMILIVVLIMFFLNCSTLLVFCLWKRRGQRSVGEQGTPFLRATKGKSYKKMRWYWYQSITEEEEARLVKLRKNGVGSFLVRPAKNDPENNFVLAASFRGELQHLTLVQGDKRLKCPSTGKSFDTVCDVVSYYRKHDIVVSGKVWGKLSKPFEREILEDWYFGYLAVDHQKRVLLSGESTNGSFLVAEAYSDKDAYYLMVNFGDKIHRFGIAPEDTGMRMVDDMGIPFKTLADIVEYYHDNDLKNVSGGDPRRLRRPCSKNPDVDWYFNTLTDAEMNRLLQSNRNRPGSFLITGNDTLENTFILAVNLTDGMKKFEIRGEREGFLFCKTGMYFHSWYELVDYYTHNQISVDGKEVGTLSRPFRRVSTEPWYFGPLTVEDTTALLLADGTEEGSFLIRDGTDDPDNYVLAVKFNGKVRHFTITPQDAGFLFAETGKIFDTLSKLVQCYQTDSIGIHRKLTRPAVRRLTEQQQPAGAGRPNNGAAA